MNETSDRFNPLALESGWKALNHYVCGVITQSFNPLALESGWKARAIYPDKNRLLCFNPLALESGWKEIINSICPHIRIGFNPLALESGWKVFRFNFTHILIFWFQSACAGEWLESKLFSLDINPDGEVSIRLRWRVVGKDRRISKRNKHLRFNPLALESGWKGRYKRRDNQANAVSIRLRWRVVGKTPEIHPP